MVHIEAGRDAGGQPNGQRSSGLRVHEVPVLDGPHHEPKVLPQHRLPQFPAHRHPADVRIVGRLQLPGGHAGPGELHPRRDQDLVGPAAQLAYATLEFRICDACTRVDEAVCVAALFQAIVAKLWKLRRDNMTFRVYPHDLIEENKWRAVRYGLDGKLIDLGKQAELPARDLIRELIEWFVDDVVDDLGTRKEVAYAYRILEEGTSADRQLATYGRTGDMRAVVDQLVRETAEGVEVPA